jgi:hypothetical protein
MISRITQAIARLLTPWRTIRQLEREVKRLEGVIANPYLAGLQIGRDTGIEVGCRGSGPQLLAGMFEGLLEKDGAAAPNYLDLEFHTRRQGRILVHVQRLHGETPHALRVKAEKKAAEWKAVAQELLDVLVGLYPMPLSSAARAAMQAHQDLKTTAGRRQSSEVGPSCP